MKNVRPTRRTPHPNTALDLAITFGLFILSKLLFVIISTVGVIYEVGSRILARDWLGLADWFYVCAASDDQAGGVYNMTLFNDTLIDAKRPNAHLFGNKDEVISSVLGKNKDTETLTPLGRWVAAFLDYIDPYHTTKSQEHDEANPRY